jgi:NAD(P)-dependent dehydrogenase (short-subunit alcohol dehydrogenase family)
MSKIILITGSSRGIGFEIARQCGIMHFHVILSGRNESNLIEAVEKLHQENIEADLIVMDISNKESIKNAAVQFATMNLKIDVLINNAAILEHEDTSLLDNDELILEKAILTNSYGPLYVTKSFLPFIKSPGKIIMISSEGGILNGPLKGWSPAYCLSKTLLNAITKQLAFELLEKDISVNAVTPGYVRTDMEGINATQSVEKAAESAVWLAIINLPDTGRFWKDKKIISW